MRGRAPPGRGGGFTLLEMMVVLAILGLVLGLVAARGPPRSAGLDVRAAAVTVAQVLREARAEAVARNRPVVVAIDTAGRRLATGPRVVPLPPGVVLAVTGTAAGAATNPGIAFAPDGSSGGGTVGVAGAGRRFAVAVSWLTGRVSVSEPP